MRRPGYLAGFDDYGITGQEVNKMRMEWGQKQARRQRWRQRPGLAQDAAWVTRSRERRTASKGRRKRKGWFSRLLGK